MRKVLLVDDDAGIRRIGQLSLKNVSKYEVLLATSGYEALDMVPKEKPDVILLDVMMPGLDGPSTLAQLFESGLIDDVPVIFMTAKVQKQEVESYYKLGAAGVISKPFDPMTLGQEIESIIKMCPNTLTAKVAI